MYGIEFAKATVERAVGSTSAVLVAALTADGTNLFAVHWKPTLGLAGGAFLVSILASLAKGQVGPEGPGIAETTRGAGRDGEK